MAAKICQVGYFLAAKFCTTPPKLVLGQNMAARHFSKLVLGQNMAAKICPRTKYMLPIDRELRFIRLRISLRIYG